MDVIIAVVLLLSLSIFVVYNMIKAYRFKKLLKSYNAIFTLDRLYECFIYITGILYCSMAISTAVDIILVSKLQSAMGVFFCTIMIVVAGTYRLFVNEGLHGMSNEYLILGLKSIFKIEDIEKIEIKEFELINRAKILLACKNVEKKFVIRTSLYNARLYKNI